MTGNTLDIDSALLDAARVLMYDVFDDMAEDDWEHALGGIHAIVCDQREVIAHASLIERHLLHQGRVLRAGYVEAVAVRADRHRQGHGSTMMRELERAIRGSYDVGALGATDEGAAFYAGRGWQPWRGPLSVLAPTGLVPTPDEAGCVYVLPVDAANDIDLDGELTCDWREGDVW